MRLPVLLCCQWEMLPKLIQAPGSLEELKLKEKKRKENMFGAPSQTHTRIPAAAAHVSASETPGPVSGPGALFESHVFSAPF